MPFVELISKAIIGLVTEILTYLYSYVIIYFTHILSFTLLRAMRYYDYPSKEREDVFVELADIDKVKYGEVFKGRILLEVSTKIFGHGAWI